MTPAPPLAPRESGPQLLGGFAGRIDPKRRNAPTFPQVGEANSKQPPPKTAQKPKTHGEIGACFLRNHPEPAGGEPAGKAAGAATINILLELGRVLGR